MMMESEQTTPACVSYNNNNNMKNELQLKFCIHCSNPCSNFAVDDDRQNFQDFILTATEFPSSSTLSSSSKGWLSKALYSIFKLNYINAFDSFQDGQIDESDLTLCQHCNVMFNNLYQLYNDFLVFGKIDSYLKKKLERLDDIIDCHQQKSINCDFIIGGGKAEKYSGGDVLLHKKDNNNLQKDHHIVSVKSSRRASRKKKNSFVKVNKNSRSILKTTTAFDREPRVILTRLPENYSSNFKHEAKSKVSYSDDDLSDVASPPDNYDDDYKNSPFVEPDVTQSEEESSADDIDASEFPLYNPKTSLNRRKVAKKSKQDQEKGDKPKRGRGRPRISATLVRKRGKGSRKVGGGDGGRQRKGRWQSKLFDVEGAGEAYQKKQMTRRDLNVRYMARKVKFPNPCWYCDRTDFSTPPDVLEHTKNVHLPNFLESSSSSSFIVVCGRCSKILSNEGALKQHLKKCELVPSGDTVQKIFQCSECPKKFSGTKALRSHIKSHSTDRPFPCDECPYRGKVAATLKVHKEMKHRPEGEEDEADERVQCDVCGKCLKNSKFLGTHKRYMHTEEGKEKYKVWLAGVAAKKKKERMAIPKPTFCTDCNVELYSRLGYINHRREFHGDNMGKQNICHICGKDFLRPHSLTLHHRRVHSDERPFLCTTCGKGFKRNDNLKAHFEQVHTEEGRLKYNARMRERHRRMKIRAKQLENAKLQLQIRTTYPDTGQANLNLGQPNNNLHLGDSSFASGGEGGNDFWQAN